MKSLQTQGGHEKPCPFMTAADRGQWIPFRNLIELLR